MKISSIKLFQLFLFCFFLGFSTTISVGQKLVKADQFIFDPSVAGFEEKILSQKIDDIGIVSLGKNRNENKGWFSYILELRKPDLESVWTTTLQVNIRENFLQMKVEESRIALLSVIHDEKQKQSQLQVTLLSLEDGTLLQEEILSEHTIQPWQQEYEKGAVKQNFENIILSGNKEFTTPLEYRYYISSSPDNQKFLAYRYDFSQSDLFAEVNIFNEQWQEEKNFRLPIDKGYLNAGLYINNSGKIFLLNTKTDGNIAVIRFDPDTENSSFLEISPSNSLRNSFKFDFEDNDHILISNLSYRNSQLTGLMFSRFNFQENKIDWVKYQEFSDNLKENNSLADPQLFANKNYELVETFTQNDTYTFILENRDYIAAGQAFDYFGGDHINNWKFRKAKITTGDLIVLNFYADQELNWIQLINKNQSNSSEDGLTTSSFVSEIFEKDLNILFAISTGTATKLNHVNLKLDTGEVNFDELPNQHNLVLVKNYAHWLDPETLVLAGKKGLKGKSSMILKYKL